MATTPDFSNSLYIIYDIQLQRNCLLNLKQNPTLSRMPLFRFLFLLEEKPSFVVGQNRF